MPLDSVGRSFSSSMSVSSLMTSASSAVDVPGQSA
jgi:hypothetical protein